MASFPEKLKFRPVPINTKLELGSTSKVHCNADGQSPPVVRWLKENSTELPEHVRDDAGTLIFNGVRHADKGLYTCVATNNQGKINATISVDVVSEYSILPSYVEQFETLPVQKSSPKVVLLAVKPQFKIKPENTTAREGYPIMLHCVVIGDPQPTVNWDKNMQMKTDFDPSRIRVSVCKAGFPWNASLVVKTAMYIPTWPYHLTHV